MIDLDKHVGKLLVAFDIGNGISPSVEIVVSPDKEPKILAEQLQEAIHRAICDVLGVKEFLVAYGLDDLIKVEVHPRTGIIKIKEERIADMQNNLREVQDIFAKANKIEDERIKNHPDNGKKGFWCVDGIRHSAVVQASSAPEAIEKALKAEKVGDWESPDASFIGEEMPEVW